jgi:HD-like signal output (HDOD) protein
METRETIFKRLDSVQNLPTLPAVIQELGKIVRDPNSDARKVAKLIEDDPAMMARILKVSNSVFYAGAEPVKSVQHAVSRMGMRAVNNLAMSTAVFGTFQGSGREEFDRNEFWRHSICTGIGAMVVYEKAKGMMKRRFSRDLLHLAGLLHDIGKILMDQFFHVEFMAAVQASRNEKRLLRDAERGTLGTDHTDLGAWLGARWRLSDDLLAVVRGHHDPDTVEPEHWELTALIHTANYICNLEHIGDGGDASPGFQQSLWKRIGLGVGDIPEVVDRVKEESKHSEVLMALK